LGDAPAAIHYAKALSLILPDDHRRARVLVKLGLVTRFLGDSEEAIAHYEEAARLFWAASDERGEGEAAARVSAVYWDAGRPSSERQSVTRKSIGLLEQAEPGPELVYAYKRAAEDAAYGGVPTQALEWAEKALAVADRVGDVRGAITALGARGLARCDWGRPRD
jgi:tetratricopeptide (TPR) repeat protein